MAGLSNSTSSSQMALTKVASKAREAYEGRPRTNPLQIVAPKQEARLHMGVKMLDISRLHCNHTFMAPMVALPSHPCPQCKVTQALLVHLLPPIQNQHI